jgi:AraC-like DNA-binding protein
VDVRPDESMGLGGTGEPFVDRAKWLARNRPRMQVFPVPLLAKSVNYFGMGGFPITVRRVETLASGGMAHPHDVTEIEHWHDFCELVVVAGGRAMHLLEGKAFHISTGDVFVVQGRQTHCFRERDRLVLLNVMYDPAQIPLPLGLLRRLPGYSALFMLEPAFRNEHHFSSRLRLGRCELGKTEALVERMEAECARPADGQRRAHDGHEAALLALLVELMVFLSRHYEASSSTEGRELLRLGGLVSLLERRYDEPWTLKQLATHAGMSRTNLLLTFKRATGQSPIDFIIALRIAAACRLLRQTSLGVTEIALACGYADGNYFARQFHKVQGVTPSAYRGRERNLG